MASIKWDSELMTNYAEALNVPFGKKLGACVDVSTKHPAVFSLSKHPVPKLQLIRVDDAGHRILIDLARLLNVPSGSVIEAFDVKQSEDFSIFLSFSVKLDDRSSNLWIVNPFRLANNLTLTTLPIRSVGRVHDITISPYRPDGSGYPAIYLMHQPLDRTSKNSDLALIQVNMNEQTWGQCNELTLPTNVQKILDIAPAYGGFLGHGLFYLTEQSSKRSLYGVFVRAGDEIGDRGTATQFKFPCPEDALSIATFTDFNDSENRSSLLIGCGDGVHLLPADELTLSTGVMPIMINNDSCLSGARDLYVTQTEADISLFAINSLEELVFLTSKLEYLKDARAAPILPSGSLSSFAALIAGTDNNAHHSLICNDERGNMALLQQALDTGIWRKEPFYVASPGEMMPFESYTVTIAAAGSDKKPLINGGIFLQTPSMLPVVINGRTTMLSPAGSWYSLDNAGELGLIIPTKSITSQLINVKSMRDFALKNIDFAAVKIDPASKVLHRMGSLDTEHALLNAQSSDGKSLWEGTTKPSDEELKNAAKCFAAIKDAYQTLPKDGSIVKRNIPAVAAITPKSPANIFMDAFLWLRHKVQQATDWVVRKAGEAWEFVCDLGGKAVSFVLDCIEKVTEAASWVWDKLKVGWNKLCEFVGFTFNWSEILETKNTIIGFVSATIDTTSNRVEGFNSTIDKLFSNIQGTIASATGATNNPNFKKLISNEKQIGEKEGNEIQDSAPGKWISERMKNGNAGQQVVKDYGTDDSSDGVQMINIWSDRVEPILKEFNTLIDNLYEDIVALFKNSEGLSQEALFSKLGGNLLINILEVVKSLLQAVISVIAKLIAGIKSVGNMKLSGGFLDSFYRLISKGKDLTLFEAVGLLIAIPSTSIIKLVTKKSPPTFQTIDSNLIESIIAAQKSEFIDSTLQPANNETLKDVTTFVLGCGCGAALVDVYVSNVKIAWKAATGGVSIAVDSISPSVVMELFGMVIDAFSIYKDLLASPTAEDTPGKELMDITIAIKSFRLAANGLYMFAQKLGMDNPGAEQVAQCINLITALVNFFLYSGVYAKQLDATSWEGHDEDIIRTAATNNFLETLSSIGYFTATSLKDKDPPVALVGLACFQVAAVGSVGTKSMAFRSEYKKLRILGLWRAIPSGRLTTEQAETWYACAVPMLPLSSGLWLGGFPEALAFMATTWFHDAGGAADSWFGKNASNCIFFMTGNFGGARVAARAMGLPLARSALEWSALISFVILASAQIQDFRDQLGDGARGRRTLPLVFGDWATRVLTVFILLVASVACPLYWGFRFTMGSGLVLLAGAFISFRLLSRRSTKDDRLTWHYYIMGWLPVMYSIPFLCR